MPNPVEGLLEVYKDMVEVLLVLEIFITEDTYVEDLLCGTPSLDILWESKFMSQISFSTREVFPCPLKLVM